MGLVVVLFAFCLAAEFATRYRERTRSTPPDYVPSIYYPHRRLRYGLVPSLDYYGWFRINTFGFRGREFSLSKPPGVVRIVCFGGSTTFDIGSVGKDRPWPEVLEAELRVALETPRLEVLNFGIPGAMSLDSLIDLQMRGFDFEPDLIVVYQAHNDLIYSIPPPRVRASSLFPHEEPPRSRIERWLTVNSLLYAKTQARVAGFWAGLTSPFRAEARATTPQKRDQALAAGLSAFQANLRSIVAISQANGIPVVLPEVAAPLTPPGPAGPCRACAALSDTYAGLPVERIRTMLQQYNDVLRGLASGAPAVWFIPTRDAIPSADRYYNDSVHFSPEGSRQMGKALAKALAPIVRDLPQFEGR
jgi:lysophospholipase L1-like esterase